MHELHRIALVLSAVAALSACDDGGGDTDGSVAETGAPCDGTPDGFCPCDAATYAGHTYLFCPDVVTWVEARDNCRSFGYELVRIDDADEQEFVWSVQEVRGGDAWIGLHDRDTEGTWQWSDGTALEFEHWADEQPDAGRGEVGEDCVEIVQSEQGGWNDRDCEIDYLDYICEGPA